MAVDTEAKRWSMLAFASGPARTHVFNPDTSGLVSIEKVTVLQHYGGNVWDNPAAPSFKVAYAVGLNNLIGGGISHV